MSFRGRVLDILGGWEAALIEMRQAGEAQVGREDGRERLRNWFLKLVFIIMDNLKSLQEALSVDVKVEELMLLTADLLEDLIEQEGSPCESLFNSSSPPTITLSDFLSRLNKYTQFSAECLVISIIYIDRYNMSQPEFSLNRLNVHKMLLAALLLAAKFQDDFYYDNKAFEFAGGVNALHLHQLQLELFAKLDYNLYVSQEDYHELEHKLYEVYAETQQN